MMWRKMQGSSVVSYRIFGSKVAHIILNNNNPWDEYLAMFDGLIVGKYADEHSARETIEEYARRPACRQLGRLS